MGDVAGDCATDNNKIINVKFKAGGGGATWF